MGCGAAPDRGVLNGSRGAFGAGKVGEEMGEVDEDTKVFIDHCNDDGFDYTATNRTLKDPALERLRKQYTAARDELFEALGLDPD